MSTAFNTMYVTQHTRTYTVYTWKRNLRNLSWNSHQRHKKLVKNTLFGLERQQIIVFLKYQKLYYFKKKYFKWNFVTITTFMLIFFLQSCAVPIKPNRISRHKLLRHRWGVANEIRNTNNKQKWKTMSK